MEMGATSWLSLSLELVNMFFQGKHISVGHLGNSAVLGYIPAMLDLPLTCEMFYAFNTAARQAAKCRKAVLAPEYLLLIQKRARHIGF